MVRRYEEPIEVRAGVGVVDRGDIDCVCDLDRVPGRAPSAFLWRGRLYVVRAVIGHWRERKAWWREALEPDEDDSGPRRGMPAAYGPGCPVHMDCLEQEVWRVEASPGRLAGTGVYDLAQAAPVAVPAMSGGGGQTQGPRTPAQGEWWLLCHLD